MTNQVTDPKVVVVDVSDADGCGFWISEDGLKGATILSAPDEWWSCVIPDAAHDGRDHVLVRRTRDD